MNFAHIVSTALATTLLLAACGGSDDDDPRPEAIEYTRLVSFGDSLSDVGSYKVSGVAAAGGGKYTVNGPDAQIWVERLAATANVPAPCAAQTGLNADQAIVGFPPAPVTGHPDCFDYAQGGARVTDPIGIGNAATLAAGQSQGALGALTVPVKTQITNHLTAHGGTFGDTALVTVWAGSNDLFVQLSVVSATVAGGGNAQTAGQAATQQMGVAGAELAAYVKSLIVANGAKRVVLVNVPDISKTPFGLAQAQNTRDLIELMAFTFNEQLKHDLAGVPEVLIVDAYQAFRAIAADPAAFGVTNATTPACDLTKARLGSLVCSAATLIPGDVSRYMFADPVHPTPYGYQLVADTVIGALRDKGWLQQ